MVQDYAVNLLVRQDAIDKTMQEDRQVRLAMLASGKYLDYRVFPDIFNEPEPEGIDLSDDQALFKEDTAYDYSGVLAEDPENYEATLAAMLGAQMADSEQLVTLGQEWL